ncbi:MAG: glucose 1-dehydrogenase [bacterium]|nr:glucose 1-dehydrogenase [bacterium]
MRLEGKVCIITGAGSGQGRAAALRFAEEGARVVIAEIDAAAGAAVAEEISAAGGEAVAVECDVSIESDWQRAVAAAVERFDGVDVLYNNAAVAAVSDGSVVDVPLATWDRTLAVNITGPMLGCRCAIPEMLRRGGGSIINTSSIRAFVGGSQPIDAYTASKGALISLTRSLAVVYGPQGIRANVIAPGTIRTPMAQVHDAHGDAGSKMRLARYPVGRFGEPAEIADLALYLACDESRWTNGAVMVIDGGAMINYV